jgi:hypothetical protein
MYRNYFDFLVSALTCWLDAAVPEFSGEMAMKTALPFVVGLVLAVLSNAPANAAQETRCFTNSNTVAVTVTTGGPCPKIASSYAECLKVGKEWGWDGNALSYACATQGYKN